PSRFARHSEPSQRCAWYSIAQEVPDKKRVNDLVRSISHSNVGSLETVCNNSREQDRGEERTQEHEDQESTGLPTGSGRRFEQHGCISASFWRSLHDSREFHRSRQ